MRRLTWCLALVLVVSACSGSSGGANSTVTAPSTVTLAPDTSAHPPFVARTEGAGTLSNSLVATYPDGSTIIAGDASKSVAFGATTFDKLAHAAYVAKLDRTGKWLWAVTVPNVVAAAISTLPDGSALVGGDVNGPATFGATQFNPDGMADVFVARIDAKGTWVWASKAGGPGNDMVFGLAARPDGSSVLTGTYGVFNLEGGPGFPATFGPDVLPTAEQGDGYLAGIAADGTWQWGVRVGSPTAEDVAAPAILPDGTVVVAGNFTGTLQFGATSLSESSPGQAEAFVAALAPDHTWKWAVQSSGGSQPFPSGMVADADGSVTVVGNFSGTPTFGDHTLAQSATGSYVARVTGDGKWAWVATPSAGGLFIRSAASLPDGSVLVAGVVGDDATGAVVGSTTLTPLGGHDAAAAKLSADGKWVWAVSCGGTDADELESVAVFADGTAVVSGLFKGTATVGGATLTAQVQDLMVFTLGADGTIG